MHFLINFVQWSTFVWLCTVLLSAPLEGTPLDKGKTLVVVATTPSVSTAVKPQDGESPKDTTIRANGTGSSEEDTNLSPEETTRIASEELIDDPTPTPRPPIVLDHIDFIQLRLKHIARRTSSNISELRELQKKEFELNANYKQAWESALSTYNNALKEGIQNILLANYSEADALKEIPDEYHVAVLAYTGSIYRDFNTKTREVCSGKDIDDYHYKSYFKLLLLAVQLLGEMTLFRSQDKFLYRGTAPHRMEVGQILGFQHFVSTSSNLRVAEEFEGEGVNSIFEIHGPLTGTSMNAQYHSFFEGEAEILVTPFQVYKVESKHVGKFYVRYVLLPHDLKADENNDCGFEPGRKKKTATLK